MSMYDKLGDLLKKMDSIEDAESKKKKKRDEEKSQGRKKSKKSSGKSSKDISKKVSKKKTASNKKHEQTRKPKDANRRISSSRNIAVADSSEIKSLKSDLKELNEKVSLLIDILQETNIGQQSVIRQQSAIGQQLNLEQQKYLEQQKSIVQIHPDTNNLNINQLSNPDLILKNIQLNQLRLTEQRIDWYKVIEYAINSNYLCNNYTFTRFLELLMQQGTFSNLKEKWNRLPSRSVYLKKYGVDWSEEYSKTRKIGNTTRDILDLFYLNGNKWLTSLEIFNILNQKDPIAYDSTHPKRLGLRRVRNVLNRLKKENIIEKKREKDGRFYFRLIIN